MCTGKGRGSMEREIFEQTFTIATKKVCTDSGQSTKKKKEQRENCLQNDTKQVSPGREKNGSTRREKEKRLIGGN